MQFLFHKIILLYYLLNYQNLKLYSFAHKLKETMFYGMISKKFVNTNLNRFSIFFRGRFSHFSFIEILDKNNFLLSKNRKNNVLVFSKKNQPQNGTNFSFLSIWDKFQKFKIIFYISISINKKSKNFQNIYFIIRKKKDIMCIEFFIFVLFFSKFSISIYPLIFARWKFPTFPISLIHLFNNFNMLKHIIEFSVLNELFFNV